MMSYASANKYENGDNTYFLTQNEIPRGRYVQSLCISFI